MRRVHPTRSEKRHGNDPYHRRVAAPSTVSSLSASDAKSLRSNWAGQARMAGVYEALAQVATNPRARDRLIAPSATEKRHDQAWAEPLATCGVRAPDRRPPTTARAPA